MWYGELGNLPIPSNTSGYLDNICSLLVIAMFGFSFWIIFIDADVDAWFSGPWL